MLVSGDLNPFLQPALPAAVHAALRGDPAMLLRLRRDAGGPPTTLADLSAGLNATTDCLDTRLPYALSTPLAARPALVDQGLSGYSDQSLYPFTRATVQRTSVARDCLLWPGDGHETPPSDAPLPDVPALILDGRLDLRTPLENGRALARELPRASVVTVAGTGHDELDSDITGCTAVALRRFVSDRTVGDPCAGHTNAVAPYPIAPRALGAFRVAPGTRGGAGRVISAVIVSVLDARIAILQDLFAGFSRLRGGGLRGGSYALHARTIALRRYSYLPGLRVSGRLRLGGAYATGDVRVDGPGRLDGRLRLSSGGAAIGRLAGHRVRGHAPGAVVAAARRGGALPRGALLARWERRAGRIVARRRVARGG